MPMTCLSARDPRKIALASGMSVLVASLLDGTTAQAYRTAVTMSQDCSVKNCRNSGPALCCNIAAAQGAGTRPARSSPAQVPDYRPCR
jgi:hypothetical protein